MTPEQIEQLIRELMKTGEILATKGFELAVRQIYVQVVGAFITSLVAGILAAASWKMWRDSKDEFLFFVFAAAASLLSLGFAYDAIARLINPEWYALKLLLETFLGG